MEIREETVGSVYDNPANLLCYLLFDIDNLEILTKCRCNSSIFYVSFIRKFHIGIIVYSKYFYSVSLSINAKMFDNSKFNATHVSVEQTVRSNFPQHPR